MNYRDDKLARMLHERLADRRTEAPDGVWERIERTMAAVDAAADAAAERPAPISIVPHRRRLGLRRVWYYGIAASMLLGLYLLNDRMADMTPAVSPEILTENVSPDPAGTPVLPVVADGAESLVGAEVVAMRTAAATEPSFAAEDWAVWEIGTESEPEPAGSVADSVSVRTTPVPAEQRTEQRTEKRPDAAERETYRNRLQQVLADERGRRSGGRVSASLYASNLSGVGQRQTSPARVASAGMSTTELVNSDMGMFATMASSGTVRLHTETKLEHRVPVTVGVNARYGITDRWAVESGVTYTYLHSKSKSKGVFEYDISQELHYIGVPAAVSYKFVDGRRVEMYVKAGGAVERAVSARKVFKVTNSSDDTQGRQSEKIDCDGVQLSVGASVGAELKLSERVGLYAEAGAGYFFDNGQPMSYRTENPASVTLQAGIRLHLGKN